MWPLGGGLASAGHHGEEVLFDFVTEIRASSQVVAVKRCTTLEEYAARISKRVNQRLREAIQVGDIRLLEDTPYSSEQGRAIVEIYIDGYLRRRSFSD